MPPSVTKVPKVSRVILETGEGREEGGGGGRDGYTDLIIGVSFLRYPTLWADAVVLHLIRPSVCLVVKTF